MVAGLAQFSDAWEDHPGRLIDTWHRTVGADDWVLCPGDISAASKWGELSRDLMLFDHLPGQKVVAPGNHDDIELWEAGGAVGGPRSYLIVAGDALRLGPEDGPGVVVAGVCGWPAPEDPGFQLYVEVFGERDSRRRFHAELGRLEKALRHAQLQRRPGDALVVLHHHPPHTPGQERSAASARIERAGAELCLYGHLHRPREWRRAVCETRGGCRYQLVAADALGMQPLEVGGLTSDGFRLASPLANDTGPGMR